MNEQQQKAIEYMVSEMACNLALVRWQKAHNQISWDCAAWHNDTLDKHLEIIKPFGDKALSVYAGVYVRVCEQPMGHMR